MKQQLQASDARTESVVIRLPDCQHNLPWLDVGLVGGIFAQNDFPLWPLLNAGRAHPTQRAAAGATSTATPGKGKLPVLEGLILVRGTCGLHGLSFQNFKLLHGGTVNIAAIQAVQASLNAHPSPAMWLQT